MKRKIYLLVLSVTAGFMSACTFLDPLPNGSYNDENFELYPELLRGFVDVVYNELLPETYLDNYYIPMSCATDDAIYSSPTLLGDGTLQGIGGIGSGIAVNSLFLK